MKFQTQLFDLVLAFSRMLDRVMPELAGHNTRVGFFAGKVGEKLGLPMDLQHTVVIAGLIHDVGALPLRVTSDDLIFERNTCGHSIAGERLIHSCPPLRHLAISIRYHHASWPKLDPNNLNHRLAALINLADRVDVFIQANKSANCLEDLQEFLRSSSGKVFCPSHVEAMLEVLADKTVQARILRPNLPHLSRSSRYLAPERIDTQTPISANDIKHFSLFMGHVIDYRSPFTATHSAGVAQTACTLATLAELPSDIMDTLYIAGMLHDIGKLDVPLHILEKPGPLTREEAVIMSSHAELSEQWLNAVPGFEKISEWGSLHHERVNGSGYPHGYGAQRLEIPSRLMAVADVFTAITEDRPYRVGMPLNKAINVLKTMGSTHLDHDLVTLAVLHAEEIDATRKAAQSEAGSLYTACQVVLAEGENVHTTNESSTLAA